MVIYKKATLEPHIPVTAVPFGLPKSSNGKCTFLRDNEQGEVTIFINIRSDRNGTLSLGTIGESNTPSTDTMLLVPQWSKVCSPKNLQINKDGTVYILGAEKDAWYKTQVRVQL